MKKKFFVILTVLLCATAMIISLASCDKKEEECEHLFADGVCKYCGEENPEGRFNKEGAFTYMVEGNGCRIIAFDPSAHNGTVVEIPSSINGKPVFAVYSESIKGVFEDCTTIEKVVIPNSVTSIAGNTFKGCTSLKSLTTCHLDGFASWFANNAPESLKEIIIMDGRNTIGFEEFRGCEFIESITIPAGIESFDINAFEGCRSLKNIYYKGTIEDWCNIEINPQSGSPMTYADSFYLWENGEFKLVETLVIPEGVKTIKRQTFDCFGKIEKVIIPDSVEEIEGGAFYGCTSLKTIVLGSGVKTIGNSFANCDAVSEVWYKGSASDYGKISINSDTNYWIFADVTKYYYAEEFSVFDYADGKVAWHYNDNGEIELWSFNVTNTVATKRYRYASTELTVTDEYWDMLKQSEEQGMLEYVLEADALAIYKNSKNKEEFQAGMLALTQNSHAGIEIVFEDNMIKVYQNGEQATYPLQYIEVDGSEIYYTRNETLAYTIKDGKIVEDLSNEYGTIIHTYAPVSE